jgi:hypothetical protein
LTDDERAAAPCQLLWRLDVLTALVRPRAEAGDPARRSICGACARRGAA